MAFERPTLAELVDQVQADFVSRLELTGAVLRRSVVRVLARVVAGAAHMVHGHLDYLARQLFPDQSEAEFLERQGSLFGVTRNPPEFASGSVVVWGTNGTTVLAGSTLLRSDGVEYETTGAGNIATLTSWASSTIYSPVGTLRKNGANIYELITTGTSAGSGGPTGTGSDITDGSAHWRYVAAGSAAASVAIQATVAAEDGNCDVGTELTFESPVAGANSTGSVATGGLTAGADQEEEEDYRTRVLERMRNPPHGGSEADYIAWAKDVAGVTRVWVYPEELGAGTVTVRFMRDDDADPIPDSGAVEVVQEYIDERRPVTAAVTVVAPTAVPRSFTFTAITPNTAAVKAAVEAELADLLRREGEPGATLLLSSVRTAIGNAEGIEDYTLSVPASNTSHTVGQIPTMGTVTWP